MVWTSKQVSTVQVVRNWRIVHTGNIGGAVATAFVVFQSVVFQDNQLVIEKI
jgi:formate/nitrite transporter FocA (FNT family)